MDQPTESRARAERIHFLDVARALLMVLGIPFHAALIYTGWSWVVSSPEQSKWLEFVPPVLSAFRMPAFFLIAGFFAAFLLERRSVGRWLRLRAIRLGIPLLTGLVVIIPLQDVILALGPKGVTHLPHDTGAMLLSHLWFLPVLLMLCVALAAVWKWIARLDFPDLPAWALGVLFGTWALGHYGLSSVLHVNLAPFDGLLDLDDVLEYAPYFLLGIAIRRNHAIFDRFRNWHWPTALIGVLALTCQVIDRQIDTDVELVAYLVTGSLAAVCVSQMLLALLARLADRPIPLVEKLVDASFSIYLFHHPLIIVLSLALLGSGLPPLAQWLVICIAALVIAYAMHRVMRRSQLLLFLFNGVVPKNGEGLLVGPSAPRPSLVRSLFRRQGERPA